MLISFLIVPNEDFQRINGIFLGMNSVSRGLVCVCVSVCSYLRTVCIRHKTNTYFEDHL